MLSEGHARERGRRAGAPRSFLGPPMANFADSSSPQSSLSLSLSLFSSQLFSPLCCWCCRGLLRAPPTLLREQRVGAREHARAASGTNARAERGRNASRKRTELRETRPFSLARRTLFFFFEREPRRPRPRHSLQPKQQQNKKLKQAVRRRHAAHARGTPLPARAAGRRPRGTQARSSALPGQGEEEKEKELSV